MNRNQCHVTLPNPLNTVVDNDLTSLTSRYQTPIYYRGYVLTFLLNATYFAKKQDMPILYFDLKHSTAEQNVSVKCIDCNEYHQELL
jgi:hypothetical protein